MRIMKVTQMNNHQFLEVYIKHGDYNALEEKGSTKTLIMNESDFIVAIGLTVSQWPKVELPKASRPLDEIMRTVYIKKFEDSNGFKPRVRIPLSGDYKVTHYYWGLIVLLPLEIFAIGAVSRLSENPELKIGNFVSSILEDVEAMWPQIVKS